VIDEKGFSARYYTLVAVVIIVLAQLYFVSCIIVDGELQENSSSQEGGAKIFIL
jgi:hypothetical protein